MRLANGVLSPRVACLYLGLLLTACGGGGDSASGPQAGAWTGRTSQGRSLSFMLSADGALTTARLAYDVSSSTCSAKNRVEISGINERVVDGVLQGSFDTGGASPDIVSYSVRFSAPDAASGSFQVSGTCGTANITWSAAPGAAVNARPVADAGADQSGVVGELVQLSAGGDDADNDPLQAQWRLTVPPTSRATLSDPASNSPRFAPDVAGIYVAHLTMTDGTATSDEDAVTIVVSADNDAPVAHAGQAQNVFVGAVVRLDGSASFDPNGDSLSYRWTLSDKPVGSAASLDNASSASPTFNADRAGVYAAHLIVNDGLLDSAQASVSISATTQNAAPVASAGSSQNVVAGSLVTLDGRGSSDANGDALTFSWTLTGRPTGSGATLSHADTAQPTFTADLAGNYIARLVVSDGSLNSAPATVRVTAAEQNVAPVADAGPAQSVIAGSEVILDGSASSDANGDPLTFRWTLVGRPVGSSAVLNAPNLSSPKFTADLAGTYVARLVVNDGVVDSEAATVMITAIGGSVAGTWGGTTGQARAISFVVDDTGVATITISFSAPACGVTGESTVTITPAIPITNGAFSYNSAAGFLRGLSGSFSSSTQASGSITFRHEDFAFLCFQTITTPWTATKQ